MSDLFGQFLGASTAIPLNMLDADVCYYPHFFDRQQADTFFTSLYRGVPWQHDAITVFGKAHMQPRLTAFYAHNSKPYSYSGIIMVPHEFNELLAQIKCKVEEVTATFYTSCLLNLYRDGQDGMGWHADDEAELGDNPIIASVSIGGERWFHFKHRHDSTLKRKIWLGHGSLLLMRGTTQRYWLHQVPKTPKKTEARINLTFRVIS